MPTAEEYAELMNEENCTWIWPTKNGVNGLKITGRKNGNFIFLPAARHCYLANLGNVGIDCEYLTTCMNCM